jgi:predicted nucleotidyltransferase
MTNRPHRMSRQTADTLLAECLRRVREVNADPRYSYRVRRARLFGSALTDAPTIGDLDLAVELVPKAPEPDQSAAEEARRRAREAEGHRFRGIIERASWPQEEVLRAVKGGRRWVSLHHWDEPATLQTPTMLVFHEEDHT